MFGVLALMRIPLSVGVLAAVLFCSQQVLEVYVLMAEGGHVFAALCALVAIAMATSVVWGSCRFLVKILRPKENCLGWKSRHFFAGRRVLLLSALDVLGLRAVAGGAWRNNIAASARASRGTTICPTSAKCTRYLCGGFYNP